MAIGDLSPDQARYVAGVAQATGLDAEVVTAWVGAESGWSTNKAGHNYLNVGPGRQYQSVDQAAAAAADLVRSSHFYAGIRSAIPAGPAAQIQAIGASPWGTNGATLADVYRGLAGPGGSIQLGGPAGIKTVGFNPIGALQNLLLPGLGDLAGGVAKATGIDKVVNTAVAAVGSALLSLVFVAGALALIGLGLARLTGNDTKTMFDKVSQLHGQAATAAKIAALA